MGVDGSLATRPVETDARRVIFGVMVVISLPSPVATDARRIILLAGFFGVGSICVVAIKLLRAFAELKGFGDVVLLPKSF